MRRLTLLVTVVVSITFGFFVGRGTVPEINKVVGLSGTDSSIQDVADFTPFWRAWNVIHDKYVPSTISTSTLVATTKIDDQALVWGAIEGLASGLGDPHTVFFPPQENESFKSDISGNFDGVGMEIAIKDSVLTVVAPLKDSPSVRAGVKAGDKIFKIDGESTEGMAVDVAVSKIRGKKGTTVELTLYTEGDDDIRTISIVRDVINIPTLDTRTESTAVGEVFVIRLYTFSANSPELFRNAIKKYVESGTDMLVLDLRGNPGGYREASVDMASWFLPEGAVVVREYYGVGESEDVYRSRGYDIFNNSLKMVVLIDEGSASASEILAGALSEHKIATLVGKRSFGKGSVQELIDITPSTSIKVTVARWLTPNGNSISDKGLEPDYEVELTREQVVAGMDPQFDKAVILLGEM